MRRVVGFAPQQLYPKAKGSGTYWIGGLVDRRSGPYVLGMRKISCPCRESNHDSSVAKLPAWLLLWPRYRSWMQFLSSTLYNSYHFVLELRWLENCGLFHTTAGTSNASCRNRPGAQIRSVGVGERHRGPQSYSWLGKKDCQSELCSLNACLYMPSGDYSQDRNLAVDCTIAC
jgi:hypothetical protein